jgi:hypothetical protein
MQGESKDTLQFLASFILTLKGIIDLLPGFILLGSIVPGIIAQMVRSLLPDVGIVQFLNGALLF